MHLEPVARVRRDERPAPAVLLDRRFHASPRAEHGLEVVLVERDAEVVDAGIRQCPGWTTTLTAPRWSSDSRSLNPSRSSCSHETPGSTETCSSPIAPVAGDQVEAELAEVARLDVAQLARDEVVVEEVHAL